MKVNLIIRHPHICRALLFQKQQEVVRGHLGGFLRGILLLNPQLCNRFIGHKWRKTYPILALLALIAEVVLFQKEQEVQGSYPNVIGCFIHITLKGMR